MLLFDYLFGSANPTKKMVMYIILIVFGTVIASYGEIQFSLIGFAMQAFGILAESSRLIMVQNLLKKKMDPICSLYYFAPVFLLMSVFSFHRSVQSLTFSCSQLLNYPNSHGKHH